MKKAGKVQRLVREFVEKRVMWKQNDRNRLIHVMQDHDDDQDDHQDDDDDDGGEDDEEDDDEEEDG